MYTEQLGWAAEEGVDFVISETNDYLGEALIALEVIQGLGLPAMVTMAPTQPKPDPGRLRVRGRVPHPGRRGSAGRRPELRPRAADHAAADREDPGDGGVRGGRPAGAVPDRRDRADDGDPAAPRRASGPSRSRSIRSPARASTWRSSPLQARDLGVDYVGICCGAGPHHVRAMAEALGREVPASQYSPSMDLHPMFRADVSAKDAAFLPGWNA